MPVGVKRRKRAFAPSPSAQPDAVHDPASVVTTYADEQLLAAMDPAGEKLPAAHAVHMPASAPESHVFAGHVTHAALSSYAFAAHPRLDARGVAVAAREAVAAADADAVCESDVVSDGEVVAESVLESDGEDDARGEAVAEGVSEREGVGGVDPEAEGEEVEDGVVALVPAAWYTARSVPLHAHRAPFLHTRLKVSVSAPLERAEKVAALDALEKTTAAEPDHVTGVADSGCCGVHHV